MSTLLPMSILVVGDLGLESLPQVLPHFWYFYWFFLQFQRCDTCLRFHGLHGNHHWCRDSRRLLPSEFPVLDNLLLFHFSGNLPDPTTQFLCAVPDVRSSRNYSPKRHYPSASECTFCCYIPPSTAGWSRGIPRVSILGGVCRTFCSPYGTTTLNETWCISIYCPMFRSTGRHTAIRSW